MSDNSNQELSNQLNVLNISLHELIDLTDIMLSGLKSEDSISAETMVSAVSILNRLLINSVTTLDKAMMYMDGIL